MKKTNPLRHVINPLLKSRAKFFANLTLEHINQGESILDIGAGNMYIAKKISEMKNVEIRGIDVVNMNLTDLPHQLYDGKTIPFPDNSFDTCMFTFVLHHIEDQMRVFEEALRVTNNKLIIFEDTYFNKLELFLTKATDIVGNVIEEPNMNFALNFHDEKTWEKIFSEHDLNLSYKKTIFNYSKLCHHTFYVLNK